MSFFNSLLQKVSQWDQNNQGQLKIFGLNPFQKTYLIQNFLHGSEENLFRDRDLFIVCPSIEMAEDIYDSLKKERKEKNVFLFNGHDASPYSGILSSERTLFDRFKVLDNLVDSNKSNIIICTHESYILKNPPRSFFKETTFKVSESDIVGPDELAGKLVSMGYNSASSCEEPGTFTKKGEIFDIYPVSSRPVRIHYFDEMVEEIFPIDVETQKTLRDQKLDSIKISASPQIFSQPEYANQLREKVPMPPTGNRAKFEKRKRIFSQISDGHLFENYPVYVPLFFQESESLARYAKEDSLYLVFESIETSQNSLDYLDNLREQFEGENEDPNSESLLPGPNYFYEDNLFQFINENKTIEVNQLDISLDTDTSLSNRIELNLENASSFIRSNVNPTLNKSDFVKESLKFLSEEFKNSGHIIFTSEHNNSLAEIQHILDVLDISSSIRDRIHYQKFKLKDGFYYRQEKVLVLSEGDLFSNKIKKANVKKIHDVDLFAEQLASLKAGDYVIHSEHGVGEYIGLESMDVGGTKTDYLVILYKGNDKVYVPVYKMNLIQKHADSTAELSLDNLRTNKFSNLKSKAKNTVKKLAFDLLKLQAERQSSPAFSFSKPDSEYNEFELAFPFEETPDQRRAIDEVIEAMHKPVPMDYLVCGDVGFGKTEIAMRAAFKAVLDKKQVAVLVPTTVLAMQHFNSFIKRFKNFPVEIELISRFRTAKEVKDIKERLEQGKIDILVGTHKLLGNTIKFKDLGLAIVDEEQRFGVAHKEKFKLLKSTVDFLTLTATPIPRTMQLAFLGIRELSLIRTAPPRRQSIKTYLIKEDDRTLQAAIQKELNRGGQVFIVHNKVQDIEQYTAYIRELVPEANIVYAHGQLSEKELESRMSAFYKGTYQILISTTIIESGIDIPNANTIIIDRADRFGLAQLHQLRGRIGRSDKKAYAYFIIPKDNSLSVVAEKRLKALQTYADMGSGFNIASCDLEIRGAGDILGGQQSGHIEAIGLELYMELLKEAIHELRGEKKVIKKDIEINTPFPSYIPNHYITDSSERLKLYKRLSNCESIELMESIKEELSDIYGIHPQELVNLFTLLQTRINLQLCGVKSLQCAGRIITVSFDKNMLESNEELRNSIVENFMMKPKLYQFTPDYKVIYTHKEEISQSYLVEFSKEVAEKIVPS